MSRRREVEFKIGRAKHLVREHDAHPSLSTRGSADWAREQIPIEEAHLADLRREEEPYEAEWKRRGGWTRYPFVTNQGGHYHRGFDCPTCYPTTEYGLHHQVSGLSEDELVSQVGHHACTVCFPNAPTHPAWERMQREEASAKGAAKLQKLQERKARLEKAVATKAKTLERVRRGGGAGDLYEEDALRYAQQDLARFLAEHPEVA